MCFFQKPANLGQVRKLLTDAEDAAKRVTTDVTFKRPDKAYIEYIVCSEILLHIIPKNKDYTALKSERGEWHRKYQNLCKVSERTLTSFGSSATPHNEHLRLLFQTGSEIAFPVK